MPVIENLQEELRQTSTLKLISNSLAEISAIKIKTIRESFEKNSLFYEEISELYHAVKLLRSAEIEREQKKRKKALKLSRNVHVALTSNQHFYGTLNFEIINKFYENTKNTKGEKIIVGKTGKEYLEAISGIGSFISIIYEKDLPKDAEIKEFIEKIKIYDRVYIYYPKFMSIVSQKVDVVDIFRKSEFVGPIVDEAIKIGAKNIWMQEGVVDEVSANKARAAGLTVTMNMCMMKEHKKRLNLKRLKVKQTVKYQTNKQSNV